uniref:FERM domain-containing protein n=1 Tax=Xiphophorus maculatus TaxID=8083 RepID=A0A3B5PSM8_XIPMA
MFGVTYFKMKDKKEAELWLGVDEVRVKIYPKDNK